jgi:hypothetical protein
MGLAEERKRDMQVYFDEMFSERRGLVGNETVFQVLMKYIVGKAEVERDEGLNIMLQNRSTQASRLSFSNLLA